MQKDDRDYMNILNKLADCTTKEDIEYYLTLKANNHRNYKSYSSLCRIKSWISNRAIFLSDGKNWNDIHDRKAFNNQKLKEKNFGMCFSFSKSENVAMWMLYGGLNNDGVMVDFKQKHMKQILGNTTTVDLGYFEGDNFETVVSLSENQFKLRLTDVLYYENSEDNISSCDIKRSNETAHLSIELIEDLHTVKKSYPWNYENECRLIVSVDKKYIISERISTARISVGKIFEEIEDANRIYCAPNFIGETPFEKSNLSSEIDWNLCKGCKK